MGTAPMLPTSNKWCVSGKGRRGRHVQPGKSVGWGEGALLPIPGKHVVRGWQQS